MQEFALQSKQYVQKNGFRAESVFFLTIVNGLTLLFVRANTARQPQNSTQRSTLFDDRHDDVDGFLHRLKRHEFVFSMAVFGAGEQVRGRQAFVRDDAAVRSAAHRFEDRRDAAGFISLHSQIDDDRMLLDDVAHIVVLVEQRQGNPRFGKLGS